MAPVSFVPNLGTDRKGILVSIGGATDQRYVDNSVLDVYDVGAGGWTKQSTLGDTLGTSSLNQTRTARTLIEMSRHRSSCQPLRRARYSGRQRNRDPPHFRVWRSALEPIGSRFGHLDPHDSRVGVHLDPRVERATRISRGSGRSPMCSFRESPASRVSELI